MAPLKTFPFLLSLSSLVYPCNSYTKSLIEKRKKCDTHVHILIYLWWWYNRRKHRIRSSHRLTLFRAWSVFRETRSQTNEHEMKYRCCSLSFAHTSFFGFVVAGLRITVASSEQNVLCGETETLKPAKRTVTGSAANSRKETI